MSIFYLSGANSLYVFGATLSLKQCLISITQSSMIIGGHGGTRTHSWTVFKTDAFTFSPRAQILICVHISTYELFHNCHI